MSSPVNNAEPMEVDNSIMPGPSDADETEDTSAALSDAGKFSCAALCALSLNHLFHDPWDQPFNRQCIERVVAHFHLPQQVLDTMYELIKADYCQSSDAYIDVIRSEASLVTILHDLVALGVNQGQYDARWRVLVHYLSRLMLVDFELVETFENRIAESLSLHHQHESNQEEDADAKKRRKRTLAKRYALIGLASVGGGALIGVTGGLAAPLIGAGLGSVLGGSAAMALGSSTGIAVVGSLFGAAGAGLSGFKMHKRVGDIEQFEIKELLKSTSCTMTTQCKPLHISIAIHGWLTDETDESFIKPWRGLEHSKEQYYLCYESSYLVELGKAMDYILSIAVSMATQQALKYTILSGLLSAIAWPSSLLALSSVIDNPWGVCCRRAVQVGQQLAEILLEKAHGNRPVTLIGYSLGARVIFYCLREMSNRNACEGIIQDVVLIGAPCSGNIHDWSKFTRVVAGRIVNGYSRSDWLLRFLYRTLSMPSGGVAGLQKIPLEDRRMCNVDLTDIVLGHSEYPVKMTQILEKVGIRTVDTNMTRSQTQPCVQLTPEVLRQTKSEENLSGLLESQECKGSRCETHSPLSGTSSLL